MSLLGDLQERAMELEPCDPKKVLAVYLLYFYFKFISAELYKQRLCLFGKTNSNADLSGLWCSE